MTDESIIYQSTKNTQVSDYSHATTSMVDRDILHYKQLFDFNFLNYEAFYYDLSSKPSNWHWLTKLSILADSQTLNRKYPGR